MGDSSGLLILMRSCDLRLSSHEGQYYVVLHGEDTLSDFVARDLEAQE